VGAAATGSAAERLRARLAPLSDLARVLQLLEYDQETAMPRSGAAARAQQSATISGLLHEGMIHPEIAELLDAAEDEGVDGDDAALVREVRREADKARRVPTDLVREMSMASSAGQDGWARARDDDDFAAFLPFLRHNLELRRQYAACFEVDEPYDALLDDFEPGMRAAEVRAVFGPLRDKLPALIASAGERSPGVPTGPFALGGQRRAVELLLARVGFDRESWLLGESVHPFCVTPGRGDNRMTTRFSESSLESILSCLHEFGHALYEAQIDPALDRTPLGMGVSMSVHESQSRLWEVFVGGSIAFWRGAWPDVREALGSSVQGWGDQPESFVRALMSVQPSLIRVDADPVTYPMHIVLRFELEQAMLAGDLALEDLPGAWNDGMRDLLGVTVPDDRRGVLQDVHWSIGAFGYFPTYALGTLLAAQIWEAARAGLPDLDAQLEAGDLAPLRGWLAEHVHSHGRRLTPREVIRAATGRDLDAGPYLAYARSRAEGSLGQ